MNIKKTKKRFLNCLWAITMLASLLSVSVFAETNTDVIEIDATKVGPTNVWKGTLPGPSTDYWYYFYDSNLNVVPWVEYEVDATSTGSYHVDFAWGGTTKAKILVNGSEASYRTSLTAGEAYQTNKSWAKWQSCDMPVPLYEGKNTVRVELIPGYYYNNNYWHAGVAAIKFTKINDTPTLGMTTKAMTTATTNIPGLSFPADPWVWLNVDNLADSLFIKWNVNVPKTGYYKARVGAKSNSVATISIGNQTATFDGNATQLDSFCLSSSLDQKAPWYESGDILFLEQGTHEVTYNMSPEAKIDNQYKIKFAGFQLVEVEESKTYDGDFNVNVISPSRSYGAQVVGNSIKLTDNNKWVEYDVNVSEDSSYYVNFNRQNDVSDKAFYVAVSVNGETVNKRTGRIQNTDGSYTFQDEIQLTKGSNTIRLAGMNANAGTVSSLSFTKLENTQYTTSMNTASGGRTFKSAYKTNIGVDPWLNINDLGDTYPDEDSTAPYVTFEVNIPKAGYYHPAVARVGMNKIGITIANTTSVINDNCTVLSDKYIASGIQKAEAEWIQSNDVIYLDAGTHDVTLRLYGLSADKWNTQIGALRFIEGGAPLALAITNATVNQDGVISVKYTTPSHLNLTIIAAGYKADGSLLMAQPFVTTGTNTERMREFTIGEDADSYALFVWNSISSMKPLLDKYIVAK